MVTVSVIENILENNQKTFSVQKGITIEELIRTHTYGDAYSGEFVECYDCDTGETFFAPMSEDNDTASLSVLVNGKDSQLDYVIQDNDVVNIIFLPLSSDNWSWTAAFGGMLSGALAGGLWGSGITPGIGTLIGAVAGAIVGFFAGGLIGGYINGIFDDKDGKHSKGLDTDNLPDVRGSQNSPLTNNVFPFVMGKHIITPFIIGSPYNEMYGGHGEETFINALFIAGYAPLRITELRLGEQVLAHNQPWKGNMALKSVFHGALWGTNSDSGSDVGEIVSTWKENDITVEILQQGQNGESLDWGTIYPYARIQDDVDANVLYIVDTASDPVSYKGVSLKNGLRNNPVRMTRQCPLSATVELNVPNGLFKTYTTSNSNGDTTVHYEKIPVWMGLQWRVYSKDNQPSDGDDSGVIADEMSTWWDSVNKKAATTVRGWHSFKSANGSLGKVTASVGASGTLAFNFTHDTHTKLSSRCTGSVNLSAEVTLDSPAVNNTSVKIKIKSLLNGSMSYRTDVYTKPKSYSDKISDITVEELTGTIETGSSTLSLTGSVYFSRGSSHSSPIDTYYSSSLSGDYKITADIIVNGATVTKDFEIGSISLDEGNNSVSFNKEKEYEGGVTSSVYNSDARTADKNAHTGNTIGTINNKWLGAEAFNFQPLCGTWDEQQGINEFRIVSEVDFESWARENFTYDNEADFVRQFREYFLSSSNTTKSIEVRAVRISPNYLDQVNSTGKRSADKFNDVITWKTLTSTMFDEDRLIKDNIIEKKRPLSESDMRKHCVIAVRAKTDKTDQLSNLLKKFTCMAESFAPYYDSELKQWFPKNVTASMKYYKPNQIVNNVPTRGDEITREQFIADRQAGIKSLQRKNGNDFVKNLVTNVIRTNSHKDSQGRYYIPSEEGDSYITETVDEREVKLWNKNPLRYIENNVASMILLAGIGNHVGVNALSYDDYDMVSLAKVFEFCKSVRDGNTYDSDGFHYDHDGNEVEHNKGDEVEMYFTANAYIYEAKKLEDIIAGLSFAARSVYTKDKSNRLTFIIDKAEKYPVALINQANTLSSSYSVSYTDLPSGLQIPFKDENDGYEENNIYPMLDGESQHDHTSPIEPYNISFVTNPYQVWSLGRYLLANRIMNREVVVKKIGMEGASVGLGNLVCLQDDTMLIGSDYGGRITRLIEDEDFIYGFLINNTYHVTGTDEESSVTERENVLSLPSGFPYSAVKDGNKIIFSIPSGTEIQSDVTATIPITYADDTTDSKIIVFSPAKKYMGSLENVYITFENNILSDDNGIVLRRKLSQGLVNHYPSAMFNFRRSNKTVWYKDGTQVGTGDMLRAYETGRYSVVFTHKHTVEGQTVTESWTDFVDIIKVDGLSGYQVSPSASHVFVPVSDENLTQSVFSTSVDFRLYKNTIKLDFGVESTSESSIYVGQGVTVMQPGQYKESRVITLPLASVGTVIRIDGKPFAVKKGDTNVVVLAKKISKNGIVIDDEDAVAYYYTPQVDNIVGFGELGRESALYRVIKIKPDSKHNYEFTLLKYQPELYEYGRQLPSFQNNISRQEEAADSYNLSGAMTASDLTEAIKQASDITEAKVLAINAPNGNVFKNGQPASLTLEAVHTGFTVDSYAWYKDDTLLPGDTSDSLTVTAAGLYKCVAESDVGNEYTAYMTVIAVSDGTDGTDGGNQVYEFAEGDYNMTQEQLEALDWWDAPPTIQEGKYLWMKTKWVDGV